MQVKETAALEQAEQLAVCWRRSSFNVDYQRCYSVCGARLAACDLMPLSKGSPVLLVTGDESHVSLWDTQAGSMLWKYTGRHSETTRRRSTIELKQATITSCKFISNNAFLTGSGDGCIQKWSLTMEKAWEATCLSQEDGHGGQVTSVSVYRRGTRALTTSKDFKVQIWDTESMAVLRTFEEHGCEVFGSAALEDGSCAISTGQLEPGRASVLLWSPETGQLLHTLTGHSGWLDACDISGKARMAVAAGVHGVLYTWDVCTGALRYSTEAVGAAGAISCCRFSPCGTFLLVGGYDRGELILLESRYGQELLRVQTVQEPGRCNTATSCFFLEAANVQQQSKAAASGITAGGVSSNTNSSSTITACQQQQVQQQLRSGGSMRSGGGGGGFEDRYYSVNSAATASSSSSAAAGSGSSRYFGSSTLAGIIKGSKVSSSPIEQTTAAFTYPTRFGTVCSDGSIRVFDVNGDSYNDELSSDDRMSEVYDADVSKDGTLLAAVYMSGRFQEEVCIYDYESGELVWSMKAHVGTYGLYIALSCDASLSRCGGGSSGSGGTTFTMSGKMASVGADRGVRIYNLATQEVLRVIDTEHTEDAVCLNLNTAFDRMLTTCDGNDPWVSLWNVETGNLVTMFDKVHSEGVYDAIFTKDGQRCLSVSCDKTAALFDLASGDVIQRFVGHGSWVRFAALSHDERMLATCSNDNTVRIWNVLKGTTLHVIRDHRGTTAWAVWMHPTWLVSTSRDGTIMGFNLQAATSHPLLASGPVGVHDSVEKLKLLPSSVAGPKFPAALALTLNGKMLVLTLSFRQPQPQQVMSGQESGLWSLEHISKLAGAFPGLGVLPMQDGNTLLHRAAASGQVDLLRVLLLAHGSSSSSAPLPANADGRTPLDEALQMRNLQCVELLLANEVMRAAPLRLAVMKAWALLAAEMPAVLVKFLTALGIEECTDPAGSNIIMVPVREGTELITCGAEDFNPSVQLWEAVLAPQVDKVMAAADSKDSVAAAAARIPPLRYWQSAWASTRASAVALLGWGDGQPVLQPVVPGVCGLPHVAIACRSMADSPLGALVLNEVSDAFTTDIGFAMLTYKWDTYAGAIYRQQAAMYGIFILLYILATTLGIEGYVHVERNEMYGTASAAVIIRIVLEACVLLINARYLLEEAGQLRRHGVLQYLTGHNSIWNWVELLSGLMVMLVIMLQILGVEEARWWMSACTVLLGTRLLKVASGSEGTGIFVQIIIRIIIDLRHFLLVVLITLMTYALAFRQVMVYYEQVDGGAGISSEFTEAFGDFPLSLLSVYYFMTVGGISPQLNGKAKYVWYLHALLLSFTFMVSIILLNLLIAVMSDTYVVIKQRAKSEWMLLKARLILTIDSNMPDSFFLDSSRSAPRWLHVVNAKRTTNPAHASLLDSVRGTVVRQALNTDVLQTKMELTKQMAAITDQLIILQKDVARLSEALVSGREHVQPSDTS